VAVVVGFIPTAEGRAALEVAVSEAERRAVRLVVMVHGTPSADPGEVQAAVDEAYDRLEQTEVAHEIRHLEHGRDIADDLIGIAEETNAEILVIGLRRRSPVGKLILGSNAQRILLDAACPVLAVKPTPA
jgi:nucleotide-binding universal stress UspA family protein